jgi:beta-phosphoglucomutase family hydrolase
VHLPNLPAEHRADLAAVILDLDGVVTDTARIHAAAWKALFDELISSAAPSQAPFDAEADYRAFVDGRSREDGIRTFLAARGITVPEGNPDDAPADLTVQGLAKRKQGYFDAELRRHGASVFADTLRLLHRLRAAGIPTALVTSSRNSGPVLQSAGVLDLFTVRVDGTDALRLELAGKPDPALFLEAARRLGVSAQRCAVLEDARAGVQAAHDGGFGLVVGVDRGGDRAQLWEAGADQVLGDVAELDLHTGWRHGGGDHSDPWLLRYDGFDPSAEGNREALCTLGNGYWATRGAVPGTRADGVHYPGTYLAGAYNRVVTELVGKRFETEHLVNAPDWAFVRVETADGRLLHPAETELLDYHQQLDLRRGVLRRVVRRRDDQGRITTVRTEQFQSMADPHLAGLRLSVEAENWRGGVRVLSAINGQVHNTNVAADAELENRHFEPPARHRPNQRTVLLEARTTQSQITVAVAACTSVTAPDAGRVDIRIADGEDSIGQEFSLELVPGRPVVVEKVVAVATSRDRALSNPVLDAAKRIRRAGSFTTLLAEHAQRWGQLWERFGVELRAGQRPRLALNLHTFHVLQSAAFADPDRDASIPARGLHGEGYRGHIFWDELFVYPLLTLRQPALTRALLLYRHRRLGEARAAAQRAGLSGALFPWQSGSDGREETPQQLFNVRNGQWMPDNSRRQHHVGLAIAYSTWQYYQTTEDLDFLTEVGAELIIEVARLFVSSATYDAAEDRFSIAGIMGPDEYHDGYPDAPGQGIRDNAYTNVLASWTLARAADVLALLAHHDAMALCERLAVTDQEVTRWDHVSRRLRVAFHADGVISQFDGYDQLAEFPWESYRRRYGNIGRLDLILQAEGDSTNRYRLSKQADVLMLFYLFSAEELRTMFARLGYILPPEAIPRTVDFYLSRTSHGSTLSRLVHSWVLARTDRARSWSLFEQALEADLSDTQGGTTREGIHLGAMAGTADMVLRCYGGVETRDDTLRLHPLLPDKLPAAAFQLRYRGQPIDVEITHDQVRLRLHPCSVNPVRVWVEDSQRRLQPGEEWEIPLSQRVDEERE